MSIKRKLNRYVEEMRIPSANRVLPEGIEPKENAKDTLPKRSNMGRYLGIAGAAAACVIGLSVWGMQSGGGLTSTSDGLDGDINNMASGMNGGASGEAQNGTGLTEMEPGKEESAYADGVIGEPPTAGMYTDTDSVGGEGFLSGGASGRPEAEAPADDILNGWAAEEPMGGEGEAYAPDLQAGTLTGGEIRDLKNWDNWLRTMREEVLAFWKMAPTQRVNVYVHNGNTPLGNVHVRLVQGDTVLYEAVTDVTGNAYLFKFGMEDGQQTADSIAHIEVQTADGNWSALTDVNALNGQAVNVELEQEAAGIKVDLMYVIDTTGSMGDELEYLKVEIQDVIERAGQQTGAPIRTSVNFYRDEGDDYVVRYYDFREDAGEVAALVAQQEANGGGDEPEAVHTALDNAIRQHNWAEDSTVKLLFLVLDAPPHDTDEIKEELLSLVEEAAANGIRIIPVAASGADEDTQQLLRGMAVMTGGTFIFLDDNSGIGYEHTEPLKPEEYKSEYLNEMMIRIIGEYCGVDIKTEEVETSSTEESSTEFQQ